MIEITPYNFILMHLASNIINSLGLNNLDEHYRIDEKLIGSGSFGWVYSAVDKNTHENVAIKILKEFPDDSVSSKQLLREIKLLHILHNHPNIVSLKHITTSYADDKIQGIALIFQHYDTNLDRVIKSKQTLSIEHLHYILYQILCGIDYIHSANLVHRDLKPANILIDVNCRTVICDFGLARATKAMNITTMTAPPTLYRRLTQYVVTRWYRGPELILGNNDAGEAPADMWSIGCILAELLLRRPLFNKATNNDTLMYLIMTITGTPSLEELDWIQNKYYYNNLKKIPNQLSQISTLLKDKGDYTIDLLQKLLQFTPSKRLTAEQAIQHSFFNKYNKQTSLKFSIESMSAEERNSLNEYYALEADSNGCESKQLTQRIHTLIQKEIARYTLDSLPNSTALISNNTPPSFVDSQEPPANAASFDETNNALISSTTDFYAQAPASTQSPHAPPPPPASSSQQTFFSAAPKKASLRNEAVSMTHGFAL